MEEDEEARKKLFLPIYNGYTTYVEKAINNHLRLLDTKIFQEGAFQHLMSTLQSYQGVIALELGRTINNALDTTLKGQKETLKELIAALEETLSIHQKKGEYQEEEVQDQVITRINEAKSRFHTLLEAQKKLMKL
jgi:hypothetical protein